MMESKSASISTTAPGLRFSSRRYPYRAASPVTALAMVVGPDSLLVLAPNTELEKQTAEDYAHAIWLPKPGTWPAR